MRKCAVVLSVLLATSSIARADGVVAVKHHHHRAAVAAAAPVDPYDVKWHVLGAFLTFVTVSALMPWALQDLDASVARANQANHH